MTRVVTITPVAPGLERVTQYNTRRNDMKTITITGTPGSDLVATMNQSGDAFTIDKDVIKGIILATARRGRPASVPTGQDVDPVNFDITPLQMALANLSMFGEEKDSVSL